MGLFRSSTKTPETRKILLKKKNGIEKKASSSWEDDDSSNDTNGKPKFWRLHDELAGQDKRDDYPPSTNLPPPKEAFRPTKLVRKKKMMFQKLPSVDELSVSNTTPSKKDLRSKTPSKRSSQKKKSGRANMPLHTLNDDSTGHSFLGEIHRRTWAKNSHSAESGTSSSTEYQPPPTFTLQNEPPTSGSSGVVRDKKSSRQFQTFMHDRIAETFSDDTMDKRQAESIQTSTSDTQSAGLYSESGFPTAKGGHQFQQIVFDNQFNQIKKVKIAKSDPGASDFSDFITAAAKLTQNFSRTVADDLPKQSSGSNNPRSKTPHPTNKQKAWPRLDDRKIRDTPGYGEIRSHTTGKQIQAGTTSARSRSPAALRLQPPNNAASLMRTNAPKSSMLSPQKASSAELETREQPGSPVRTNLRTSPYPRVQSAMLPKQRTPAKNENKSQIGRPFRPKSPVTKRNPSPSRRHDAPPPPIRSNQSRASPAAEIQSQSSQSIIPAALNEQTSAPEFSTLKGIAMTATTNETRDDTKRIGPAVNTSREDWIDRSNSSSFVQSEVSFTPENVVGKEDFGFERDFDGLGEITAKNAHSFTSTDNAKKLRAESFDWDTEFHRCASPFQTNQGHQRCDQVTFSLDEGEIPKPRKVSGQSRPRDPYISPLKRRDQSPMSAQRSMTKTGRSRGSSQSQGPQKTPPKAVPTNAILGSMLFRQTQSSSIPDQNSRGSSKIGDSRSKDATQSSFIGENRSREAGSSMFSRKQSSFIAANRSKDTADSRNHGGKHATEEVPNAIMTAGEETTSVVSSVTEEASSFYKKSFGGKSPRWNGPAQTLVNNYNVRKNHLRTTTNNSTNGLRKPSNTASFSRSEEEHINVFLSEV